MSPQLSGTTHRPETILTSVPILSPHRVPLTSSCNIPPALLPPQLDLWRRVPNVVVAGAASVFLKLFSLFYILAAIAVIVE